MKSECNNMHGERIKIEYHNIFMWGLLGLVVGK